MKTQVISRSRDGKKAEVVVHKDGGSITRHVVKEADGQYHWRQKNKKGEVTIHETYSL